MQRPLIHHFECQHFCGQLSRWTIVTQSQSQFQDAKQRNCWQSDVSSCQVVSNFRKRGYQGVNFPWRNRETKVKCDPLKAYSAVNAPLSNKKHQKKTVFYISSDLPNVESRFLWLHTTITMLWSTVHWTGLLLQGELPNVIFKSMTCSWPKCVVPKEVFAHGQNIKDKSISYKQFGICVCAMICGNMFHSMLN